MSEVLSGVLDYAFTEIGLHRVQAEVLEGNDASSAVLKKCGMTLEGIARNKSYRNVVVSDLTYVRVGKHRNYICVRIDFGEMNSKIKSLKDCYKHFIWNVP